MMPLYHRWFVLSTYFKINKGITCSTCGALTGPAGLGGLAVRHWECSACGAYHDRDINSAMVVLNVGLGTSHELAVAI